MFGQNQQDEEKELVSSFLSPRCQTDSRVCKTFATAQYKQGVPSPQDKAKAFMQLPSRYYSQDDECMQAEATGFAQAQNLVRSFMRISSKASIRILVPEESNPATPPIGASGNSWSGGCEQGGPPESAPGCAAAPQPGDDARAPAIPGACPDSCQQGSCSSSPRHLAAHSSFVQRPRRLDKTGYVTFSVRDHQGGDEDADEQQTNLSRWSVPASPSSNSSSRRVVEPSEPAGAAARLSAAASKDEGGQPRSPRSQPLSPSSPSGVPGSAAAQPAQRLRKKLSGVSFSVRGEDGSDEDTAPQLSRRSTPRAISFLSSRGSLVDFPDGQAEQPEAAGKDLPADSYSSQRSPEADSTQLLMAKAFGSLHRVKSSVTADIEAKKEKLGVYRQSAAVPFAAAWGVNNPLKPAEVEPPARRFRGKQSSRPNLLLGGLTEQPAARSCADLSVQLFCCEDAIDELSKGSGPRAGSPLVQPLDLSRLKPQDDPSPLGIDRSGSASRPRAGAGSAIAADALRFLAPLNGLADSERAPASPRSTRVNARRLLCSPPGGLSPSPPAEVMAMDFRGSSPSPRAALQGGPTPTRLRHKGFDVCQDDHDWMDGGAESGGAGTCSAGQVYLPPVLRAGLEACRIRPLAGSSSVGRAMEREPGSAGKQGWELGAAGW